MLLPGSWSEAMKRRDFAAIADWFIWYFFWGGVIGLVAAGLAAFVEEYAKGIFWSAAGSGLRIFVLSVLFASASAVSGWMLGLLFGIPRSLARGTAAPNTPPAASASATGPTANAASSSATSATAAVGNGPGVYHRAGSTRRQCRSGGSRQDAARFDDAGRDRGLGRRASTEWQPHGRADGAVGCGARRSPKCQFQGTRRDCSFGTWSA
jgi:hypothetical protein